MEKYYLFNQLEIPTEQVANQLFELCELVYTGGSPWSEKQFFFDLQTTNRLYLFVKVKTKIIAFISFQIIEEECELLNFACNQRGQGIGKRLLQHALGQLCNRGIKQIFLEVRHSNQRARSLYNHLGFEKIGVRKKYYHSPCEDAVLMKKTVR